MVCRAADLFLKYFRCARFVQDTFLRCQRLAFSADTRVAIDSNFVSHYDSRFAHIICTP